MSDSKMSLYFPFVLPHTTDEFISQIFKTLELGEIYKIDRVPVMKEDEKNKKEIHSHDQVFIFLHWNEECVAGKSLRNRIKEDGVQGKIVYNDPYYWAVYKNKCPEKSEIRELNERVNCLEAIVENLLHKIQNNSGIQDEITKNMKEKLDELETTTMFLELENQKNLKSEGEISEICVEDVDDVDTLGTPPINPPLLSRSYAFDEYHCDQSTQTTNQNNFNTHSTSLQLDDWKKWVLESPSLKEGIVDPGNFSHESNLYHGVQQSMNSNIYSRTTLLDKMISHIVNYYKKEGIENPKLIPNYSIKPDVAPALTDLEQVQIFIRGENFEMDNCYDKIMYNFGIALKDYHEWSLKQSWDYTVYIINKNTNEIRLQNGKSIEKHSLLVQNWSNTIPYNLSEKSKTISTVKFEKLNMNNGLVGGENMPYLKYWLNNAHSLYNLTICENGHSFERWIADHKEMVYPLFGIGSDDFNKYQIPEIEIKNSSYEVVVKRKLCSNVDIESVYNDEVRFMNGSYAI